MKYFKMSTTKKKLQFGLTHSKASCPKTMARRPMQPRASRARKVQSSCFCMVCGYYGNKIGCCRLILVVFCLNEWKWDAFNFLQHRHPVTTQGLSSCNSFVLKFQKRFGGEGRKKFSGWNNPITCGYSPKATYFHSPKNCLHVYMNMYSYRSNAGKQRTSVDVVFLQTVLRMK